MSGPLVVLLNEVREAHAEVTERQRCLLGELPALVARSARPARQTAQQLVLKRAIESLDLALLPRRVGLAEHAHAAHHRAGLTHSVSLELAAVVPAQPSRDAPVGAVAISDDGHPQRGKDLGRRRTQRQRPSDHQPRVLIEEQRRPRPLRPGRTRREHLDRQLLVIALITLAAKAGLVPQVDGAVAHADGPVDDEAALGQTQLALERAT